MPTLPRLLRTVLLSTLLCASAMHAAPFNALGDGEKLVYKVSWGIITAGEIAISADAETPAPGKPSLMHVSIDTRTRGVISGLYHYESKTEAVIERDTGRLLWVRETGIERDKPIDNRTDFDYVKKLATHRDVQRPGRNREFTIPDNADMLDLVSALVQTRFWKIKSGDTRDVLIFGGRDIYPVTIHAEGLEKIKVPQGKHQALKLTPRMEKEPPRGVFTRGEMHVWISQEEPFLPVRMQLQLGFGSAVLSLSSHTPPKPAAPATAAPATPGS